MPHGILIGHLGSHGGVSKVFLPSLPKTKLHQNGLCLQPLIVTSSGACDLGDGPVGLGGAVTCMSVPLMRLSGTIL